MSERQSIELLKADPRNPRRIGDKALAGLVSSVEEFGDISGIVLNERTGHLVCGHQRIRALAKAGATEWTRDGEAGWIEHPGTGERFQVRIVNWDDTAERLANLAANNPAIQGEFTREALEQLDELQEHVHFEALALDELRKKLQAELDDATDAVPADGNTDPDDVPEPPAEPVTKRGDMWVLGEHRLLCGDSTSEEDVARLMGKTKAALMATDPPYGVSVVGGSHDPRERKFQSGGVIENDSLTGPKLRQFLDTAFSVALPRLEPGAAFYLWYAGTETRAFLDAAEILGGMRHVLVWVKPHFVFGRSDYHYRHEPCIYGWTAGAGHRWLGSRDQSTVFEAGRDEGPEGLAKKQHPTVKPVALFEIPMANHTRPGEACYEPFSGSGSQVIAGERLGRRVFAMELSPRYVDVAVARWEAFTGQKARRQEGR